jgi:hypothetical protein
LLSGLAAGCCCDRQNEDRQGQQDVVSSVSSVQLLVASHRSLRHLPRSFSNFGPTMGLNPTSAFSTQGCVR